MKLTPQSNESRGFVREDGMVIWHVRRQRGGVSIQWVTQDSFKMRIESERKRAILRHPNAKRRIIRIGITTGLKFGDVRDDGFIFRGYDKSKDKEVWMSPSAYTNRVKSLRDYRAKNPHIFDKSSARYREKHRDEIIAASKSPERRKKINQRLRIRTKTDMAYSIKKTCRSRMRNFLKAGLSGKSWRTMELLGCSMEVFLRHIESQFLPGMSWSNRSEWHLDHKTPFHMVDVLNPKHLMAVCHYTNIRPLWKMDNLKRDYSDVDLSILQLK